MRFYEHPTYYALAKRNGQSVDCFYKYYRLHLKQDYEEELKLQLSGELAWYSVCRPYYKIYPCVFPLIEKLMERDIDSSVFELPKDIPVSLIQTDGKHDLWLPPLASVCLRFPEGSEFFGLKTCILVSGIADAPDDGFWLNTQHQPMNGEHQFHYSGSRRCPIDYELINKYPELRATLAAFVAMKLLHNDIDFCEREILSKDQMKGKPVTDILVNKAKRRGVVGWSLGKRMETIPHSRRPHLGVRWTGKGKTIPKLVPIKGCIVKRKKLTEVPQGYQPLSEQLEK